MFLRFGLLLACKSPYIKYTYINFFPRMKIPNSSEPTALDWLKVRCYAEVPELDKLLSPLSIYGYRLAIGYFGVVKGRGDSSPSFLGGFKGWRLILAVWTPLQEIVLIWLAICRGETAARILRGGYANAQIMSRR